jgi:3-hydroxyisobutyrate dehydrogenase-like beta-hydroxyacid dehydrogenase
MEERGAVGFVGLGEMGLPMAANLVKAGWHVVAFDIVAERLREAERLGAQAASSCREVARAADGIVVSIVRTLPQTETVLFGDEGLAAAHRLGLHVVVMSTLDPGAIMDLADRAAAESMTVIDAPVSGGKAGAEAGTLAIMLAGAPEATERVRAVLECFGRNLFVLGERPGMGQAAKLANQIMLSATMLGVAEGLTLARAFGLDASQVLPIIAASTGNSWAVQNWEIARRWWEHYAPGTTLDVLHKDLRSVASAATRLQLRLPVSTTVLEALLDAWRKP